MTRGDEGTGERGGVSHALARAPRRATRAGARVGPQPTTIAVAGAIRGDETVADSPAWRALWRRLLAPIAAEEGRARR